MMMSSSPPALLRLRVETPEQICAALKQAVGTRVIGDGTPAPTGSVELWSIRGAVRWQGLHWLNVTAARCAATINAPPDWRCVLDCADAPGYALAALQAGIRTVALCADHPAYPRIADLARQLGGTCLISGDGPDQSA